MELDIDELKCILEIIPDTLPCGLAKLVRNPCREVLCATKTIFFSCSLNAKKVYIQRQRLIPDDRVYAEPAKAKPSAKITYCTSYHDRSMILTFSPCRG